jgi:hypothetical protein
MLGGSRCEGGKVCRGKHGGNMCIVNRLAHRAVQLHMQHRESVRQGFPRSFSPAGRLKAPPHSYRPAPGDGRLGRFAPAGAHAAGPAGWTVDGRPAAALVPAAKFQHTAIRSYIPVSGPPPVLEGRAVGRK